MKVVKFKGLKNKVFRIDGKKLEIGEIIELPKALEHLASSDAFEVVKKEKSKKVEKIIEAETEILEPSVTEVEPTEEKEEELEEEVEEKTEEKKEKAVKPKKRGRKRKIIIDNDDSDNK